MAMLEVKNLGISFGGLRAVNGFRYYDRKRRALWPDRTEWSRKNNGIQPADRCVQAGYGKHSSWMATEITGKSTIEISKAGIARTFQNIRLFSRICQCLTM